MKEHTKSPRPTYMYRYSKERQHELLFLFCIPFFVISLFIQSQADKRDAEIQKWKSTSQPTPLTYLKREIGMRGKWSKSESGISANITLSLSRNQKSLSEINYSCIGSGENIKTPPFPLSLKGDFKTGTETTIDNYNITDLPDGIRSISCLLSSVK